MKSCHAAGVFALMLIASVLTWAGAEVALRIFLFFDLPSAHPFQ